jgi:uncharacterized protein (DUF1015 family)
MYLNRRVTDLCATSNHARTDKIDSRLEIILLASTLNNTAPEDRDVILDYNKRQYKYFGLINKYQISYGISNKEYREK